MPDNTLIYQTNIHLRNGDHDSFMDVYNQYAKMLYHFLKKYIQDPHTVDDMVHDTFFNLWRSRERIELTRPIQNYLFRIARNVVYDELKKQIRQSDAMLTLKYEGELKATAYSVDNAILENEYDAIYDLAINRLPPQRKKIFRMHREEGLSHKEIAEFLDISPNTVKEHMSLAMKSIKDYIAKDHDMILKLWIVYILIGRS